MKCGVTYTCGTATMPPVARMRIGELLVDAKLITKDQLEVALAAQHKSGRKVGQVLIELGIVNETQLTQTLGQQLSVPWVSLYHIDFSRQLLNLVPREIAERYCLIPIYVRRVRKQGETLYIAMEDPTHEAALAAVTQSASLAGPSDDRLTDRHPERDTRLLRRGHVARGAPRRWSPTRRTRKSTCPRRSSRSRLRRSARPCRRGLGTTARPGSGARARARILVRAPRLDGQRQPRRVARGRGAHARPAEAKGSANGRAHPARRNDDLALPAKPKRQARDDARARRSGPPAR